MSKIDTWIASGLTQHRLGPNWSAQQANIMHLLFDTCTIQKPALVTDGDGGKKRGVEVVATNEPCKFDPAGGGGEPSQGKNAQAAVPVITLRHSALITLDCQIVHGGHTYEVTEVADVDTPMVLKQAKLKRIDPAS